MAALISYSRRRDLLGNKSSKAIYPFSEYDRVEIPL
jgi:hypothetical protein